MLGWQYREPQGRFFTPAQRRQVAVLLEAIVPGGPANPGATDAGAAEYVDRLLVMDASIYYDIPRFRQQYAQGLPVLAAAAAERFGGKDLSALAPAEATALLTSLAAGKLLGETAQTWQSDFFATLRAHAIEGCFADRRWGGNRDNVMWEWYGYPTGPSRDFDRATYQGPANPGPAQPGAALPVVGWNPDLSGSTVTSVKDPGELESATVVPELAVRATQVIDPAQPGRPLAERA
jgi:hypothetical protein